MDDLTVDLSEIRLDPNNANVHTDDGHDLLTHSMSSFGFIEAGVLDESNQLIGGEHRTTVATELGFQKARIVDHDPSEGPIYVRLKGFDLDSPDPTIRRKSNEASVMLNRAAQRSININPDILLENAEAFGFDISTYYTDEEFKELTLKWNPPDEPDFDDYEEPASSVVAYRVVIDSLELEYAQNLASQFEGARVEQYRERIVK